MNHIYSARKTAIGLMIVILVFAFVTPVLADYFGPDRTVTEASSTCKVVLYECQYIASKSAWKYHKVDDWSCGSESKPWLAYPSSPSLMGCFGATAGDTYWSKEEVLQEVTITHPPAKITNSLQSCNLNNGWCNTTPELLLNGTEPLSGYNILAIEGSLNGQSFACSGPNCNVPLGEGNNEFTFWALSSWGDSSEMGTFSTLVDTVSPNLGLDISASNGTNGWYVSQTSVTATGSDSTSGLSSVLLSVNHGPWESSAILNEGVYSVDVQAEDIAGNISKTSSTISVDTTTPSIDLSLNGTAGKNGWYVSNLEISVSATDATSGIDTLEVSSDGGSYTDYNSPITFSDGDHTIQFKASDNAGNITETSSQEFLIDTVAPVVDLPASWKVNETITYKVQDSGSGLSDLRVVIEDEDEKYAKVVWKQPVSGAKFSDEIIWDGKFADNTIAPPGNYHIWIKTSDLAGNESYSLGIVTVPSPFSLIQVVSAGLIPSEIPKPPKELFDEDITPLEDVQHPVIIFGGSTSQFKELESTSFSVSPVIPSASTTANSGLLWGAAAAAVVGAATAYALEEKRKREEEEALQRAQVKAEVDAKNAAIHTAQQAQWEAQKIQGWLEGQAILKVQQEEAKYRSANNRAELKEMHLEVDMRSRSAKPQEWKTAYDAYMTKKAMNVYRAGEKAEYVAPPPEKSVWETAKEKLSLWGENIWASAYKNQTELSLGTGIVVGAAAVLAAMLSTTLIPAIVVIGGAILVTAALVTAGTMAINAHFGLKPTQNLGSNLIAGIVTTVVVTGGGLFLMNAAPLVSATITSTCVRYPTFCNQISPIIDHGEELLLTAQLGYYTYIGDLDDAASTTVELQMEAMDGGVPGNSLALEVGEQISKMGPDAAEVIAKYGDDVIDIVRIHGDDGVEILSAHGKDVIPLLDKSVPSTQKWEDYIPENFYNEVRKAFKNEPVSITLSEDVTVYRYWSGEPKAETGRWLTVNPNLTPGDARELLALPDSNLADNVTQFTIPAGTTVLIGEAAEQTSSSWAGAYATGNGFQVYLNDPSVLIKSK